MEGMNSRKGIDTGMRNYLISVIVPVYNVREYLPRCIESICMQTYRNLQIILVDDGSTDGSEAICDECARQDSRIHVLHCNNGGLVAARKRGLRHAEGEYIGFVDGDDYIERNMYEEILKKAVETDADFVHTGFWICDGKKDEEIINFDEKVYDRIENSYEFIRNNTETFLIQKDKFISNSIWSKLFKSSLIKKAYSRVPDIQQYGEDGIALCRCIFESTKIVTYRKAFYHYIIRNGSISHTNEYNNLIKFAGLYQAYEALFKEYGYGDKAYEDLKCFLRQLGLMYVDRIGTGHLYIEKYKLVSVRSYLGKTIVLYGAGQVGKNYYTQLARYQECEIVAWIDEDYRKRQAEIDYFKLLPPEDMLNYKFDYIIIAVLNQRTSEQIRENLMAIGIEEEKIKWEIPQRLLWEKSW